MGKTKSKLYKTCEIMQNIEYLTEEQIKEGLKHNSIKDYAYILHNKDKDDEGNLKAAHWHIILRFTGGIDEKYICNWFNIKPQYINKIEERFVDAANYLLHRNAPLKYQYDINEVKTNFYFKNLIKDNNQMGIDEIYEKIEQGIIRRWNKTLYISAEQMRKYNKNIELTFSYWEEQQSLKKSKKINVYFIEGESEIGKSVYGELLAYQLANGGGVCIGSSENDPLQDYKDEDVLFLDELRDDCFTFTSFLKLTNTHLRSSNSSRYRNKSFYGHTIIITSCKPFRNWYPNIKEERKQLTRRITKLYHFERDKENGNISIFKGPIDEYFTILSPEVEEFILQDCINELEKIENN